MNNAEVIIKQGKLRGTTRFDRHGGEFYSFFGIPYAKPPLGELRFKAPQPPEAWDGIRDATVESSECYSRHMITQKLVGSEDCLNLNVFTKELRENQTALRPVMFWIHGGGFVTGSSKLEICGPEHLMVEDVVLVTINYRLGVLGYLSLSDPSLGVPGNAGLKDMVMALKWVQQNIRAFNGDPNNVTIFGTSAGAVSLHYLLLSPMAKNLFHKAILQSLCEVSTWGFNKNYGEDLAKNLGCSSKDEKEILKVLQGVTKEELMKAQAAIPLGCFANTLRTIGPIIEKFSGVEESFLSDTLANIMASGNYNKVPLMFGYNDREGLVYEITRIFNKIPIGSVDVEIVVPHSWNLPKSSQTAVGNKIREYYFGNAEMDNCSDHYFKMQTDVMFLRGIYTSIRSLLPTINKPIYLYRFSLDSELSLFKKITKIKAHGVCHGDECGYLFKTMISPEIRAGSIEDITVTRFTKYWANFAKYGNPNPKDKDSMFPVTWEPVTQDSLNFVDIGENLTVGVNPECARMKFWDELNRVNHRSNL